MISRGRTHGRGTPGGASPPQSTIAGIATMDKSTAAATVTPGAVQTVAGIASMDKSTAAGSALLDDPVFGLQLLDVDMRSPAQLLGVGGRGRQDFLTAPAGASAIWRWKMDDAGNQVDDLSGGSAALVPAGVYATQLWTPLPDTAEAQAWRYGCRIGPGIGYLQAASNAVADFAAAPISATMWLCARKFGPLEQNFLFQKQLLVGYRVSVLADGTVFAVYQDAVAQTYGNVSAAGAIVPCAWYLLTINWDPTGSGLLTCMINGASTGVSVDISARTGTPSSATPIVVGGDFSHTTYAFDGMIAEFMICDALTTLAQHQAWYKAFQDARLTYTRSGSVAYPADLSLSGTGSVISAAVFGPNQLPFASDAARIGADDALGWCLPVHKTVVTNLCPYSRDLTLTGWNQTNVTVTGSYAYSPDNLVRGTRIVATSNGGKISRVFSTIAAVTHTWSLCVQSDSGNVAGTLQIVKDTDGSVIASQGFTAPASQAWIRVDVSGLAVLNNTRVEVVITSSGTGIRADFAQLTATAAFPGFWVHTEAAAAANSAPTITAAAPTAEIDGAVGRIDADIKPLLSDDAGTVAILSATEGSAKIALTRENGGAAKLQVLDGSGTEKVAATTPAVTAARQDIYGRWNATTVVDSDKYGLARAESGRTPAGNSSWTASTPDAAFSICALDAELQRLTVRGAEMATLLPATVYGTPAVAMEIFDDNLTPIDPEITDLYSYVEALGADPGVKTPGKWTVTPVADATLSVERTRTNAVVTSTASMLVKAAPDAPELRILLLGDSRTANVGVSPNYPDALLALLPVGWAFLGTQTTGGAGTTHHEGIDGATAAWFATNAASPLVHSGALNIPHYITTHLSGVTPDIVFILLGVNDCIASTVAGAAAAITTMFSSLDTLIAGFEAAGCSVFVCSELPPNSDPDSFGDAGYYPATTSRWIWQQVRHQLTAALIATYASRLIPMHLTIDPVNGFDATEAIEPNDTGCAQMAAAGYAALSSLVQMPSIANLPRSITCNSTAVTPLFRYYGGDATLAASPDGWPCYGGDGVTLAKVVGTDPTIGAASPLAGSDDLAITFNAVDNSIYQDPAGSGTCGDIATEDVLAILAITVPSNGATACRVLGKYAVGANHGWLWYMPASATTLRFYMEVPGFFALVDFTGLVGGDFHLFHVFVRRAENAATGMAGYMDGVLVVQSNPYPAVGTISNTAHVTIGGSEDGSGHSLHTFCYGALYKQTNWFAANVTVGEPAAIAAAHYALLRGAP